MKCEACSAPGIEKSASGHMFCSRDASCQTCRMLMSNGELRRALLENASVAAGRYVHEPKEAIRILVDRKQREGLDTLGLYHDPRNPASCEPSFVRKNRSASAHPAIAG